ncbi:hypothetical protein LTR37_013897 [Vermiconidia calcicola]|uniref:Uncharacterized protein n=1 Tax=Vermiconidia calcicola TaxID=1690605 RepID=A0ACC3MV23_9PEZI|nr:hypothetical protein LTR37_013897 [Vermiconidia calcicola]
MPLNPLAVASSVIVVGGFVLVGAVLWPIFLRDIIIITNGLGRTVQPISDFPYQCRRISGPGLQACEDMWLSERTRQLFLACSDSASRKHWLPNAARFNVSGRSLNDKMIALDIDKPVNTGFEYRVLETPGFPGVNGDSGLHLVGMTGVDGQNHIDLYVVNAKPSVNITTGTYLTQKEHKEIGGNSTIELFRVNPEAEEVEFVKTFADPHILTPNNIAPTGKGSFYFTNDHGPHKAGTWHALSPIMKNGDVSYCNEGGCRKVDGGHGFPNGLSFGKDGLLYVPSSWAGDLKVYRTLPDGGVEHIDSIYIPYALDNLSLDGNGDLWIPGFPNMGDMLRAFDNPLGPTPPANVFRIHKKDDGTYQVDKVLEDSEGKVLPAATAVVHDVKTGRIFLSGIFSPFISVCEPIDSPSAETAGLGSTERDEL